jgi:ADP-heptose:LPS heptosyltransferase
MKLITFSRDIRISDDSDICKAKKKYIISEGFLQQIKDNFSSGAIEGIYPFEEIPSKRYSGQDLTNKSILLWRTGGMGDLCFMTPCFRHIKENYQNSKILFGCGPRFKYGVMNHPHIDNLLSLPIDLDLLESSDYYLMFEGIIENNPRAQQVNAYELFEQAFNFPTPIKNKLPVLGLSKPHVEKAKKILDRKDGQTLIGLGLKASHIVRSMLPKHLEEITHRLLQANVKVVLIGGKDDKDIGNLLIAAKHANVIPYYQHSEDFRDSVACISLLDGIIGPDSSVVHIAAAFGKPTVGVYGPFPSKLRMAHYVNASAFDIQIPCGPCFLHGVETCEYSDVTTKEPLCMWNHNPRLIVQEILALTKIESVKISDNSEHAKTVS